MRETAVAYEASSPLPFAETLARCREELAKEQLGVLSEIDIQAKLAEKLGIEGEPYVILGACHPPSAHRALEAVPEVGVLLPCNMTVSVEQGRTMVRAMRPDAVMGILDHPALAEVGKDVGARLARVIEAVVKPLAP
ncbi:MAG: DUF302 domain-containing protein [Thermoanaerobaculia bacterium]|nr:DUF302 domain-containing protein [Thermoanaerobaculia bacterium]